MVKVHGRTSKRQTLRRKYNIEKKVRGHKKKQAKFARKLKKAGAIKPQQKEPGIPNLFPFKKQMIDQMENKQRQDDENKKMAKELRRKLRKQTQQDYLDKKEGAKDELDDYMKTVNSKIIRFSEDKKLEEKEEAKELAANDKTLNQSRKAFIKDLKSVVEQADVVIEILDARDPQGCRNLEMESSVLSQNKKLVLVMNKADLIPPENAREWLKVLRDEHPTYLFKSNTQSQRNNLSSNISLHKSSLTDRTDLIQKLMTGSKAVGNEEIIQILKNY